jgi:hypothetical protein
MGENSIDARRTLMLTRETIFQTEDSDLIWKRFCGFLDLTVDEFIEIQRRLLEEQIDLVGNSHLWEKILNGQKPKTMEEFRKIVPLTNYWTHYAPYIGKEGMTDALSVKPIVWSHSSGRGGEYKWIPWTQEGLERYVDAVITDMILACADRKFQINVAEGDRFLFILAPPPYISGISGWALSERFNIKMIPPREISEKLEFQERIQLGFKMALKDGVDFVGAVSTALVKVGETMTQSSQGLKFNFSMLNPPILMRVLRAYLISKRQHRPMLPKDLWPVKGLACGGTDASIYRESLRYYWGRTPHESYGLSEGGILTMQSWAKKDMTFYPYCDFLEFIPEEEWLKNRQDKNYQPRTVLLNELQVGKVYEIVITNFHGMPLMRYRPGDLIKVTALEEKETGIKLPQVVFYSRGDGLIDLYSIVRFDEKTIWQAINAIDVGYEDWTARKEYENAMPVLRIYIEPKQDADAKKLENIIHKQLTTTDVFYAEAIQEMETNPIRVVLLAPGSFDHYYAQRRLEGTDMAHLKPPHMNASDQSISELLKLGK